jgi:general secretion pathway protein L
MNHLARLTKGMNEWIDSIARHFCDMIEQLSPDKLVTLHQIDSCTFGFRQTTGLSKGMDAGERIVVAVEGMNPMRVSVEMAEKLRDSRISLFLLPNDFIFRSIELPVQAGEFVAGIVRTQIDRLTPWNLKDAAFGWSAPRPIGVDRIACTVAAAAQTTVSRYLDIFKAAKPRAIIVYARNPSKADLPPIKVGEAYAASAINLRRVRDALIAALICSGVAAGIASVGAMTVRARLETQRLDLAQAERSAIEQRRSTRPNSTDVAHQFIEQKKLSTLPSVLILETLSEILPDHTYVTELRMDGNKVNIIGISRDAPSLIGTIEKSPRFSQASFFAPTTKSQSEAGERFHIEALLRPLEGPRS